MYKITIEPGSMGVASHCYDLFGPERLGPGSWLTPVWVNNLSKEEADFAVEFFTEYNLIVSVKEVNCAAPR